MDPQILADMEKIARQKAIIRMLESSDGQNFNHAQIESGLNKGQVAGGAYGIIPNSLTDFVKQSKNRNLPVDPSLSEIINHSPEEVTEKLNNDRAFDEKAAEMGIRLMDLKSGGDEEKAAYRWRTGHNQSDETVNENFAIHPYVQAYRREREKLNAAGPKRTIAEEKSTLDRLKALISGQ